MLYNDVVFRDEILKKVTNVVSLLKTIDLQLQKQCLLTNEENISVLATKILAFSNVVIHDPTESLIYDMIVDHCQKAESAAPGSFLQTFRCFVDLVEGKTYNDIEIFVKNHSFRPTLKQTHDYLQKFIDDDYISSLFLDVLKISGIDGKVIFEQSQNENTSIELQNGFNFKINVPFSVSFSKKNVRVLLIDGNVESISEIHNLLQTSYEKSESLLLIARGFSDDVTNTLKVNYARGTLHVIPVIVRYDFEGLNVLGDISIVTQSDVISSLKGQLISAVKYDDLKIVSAATVEKKNANNY